MKSKKKIILATNSRIELNPHLNKTIICAALLIACSIAFFSFRAKDQEPTQAPTPAPVVAVPAPIHYTEVRCTRLDEKTATFKALGTKGTATIEGGTFNKDYPGGIVASHSKQSTTTVRFEKEVSGSIRLEGHFWKAGDYLVESSLGEPLKVSSRLRRFEQGFTTLQNKDQVAYVDWKLEKLKEFNFTTSGGEIAFKLCFSK